MKWYLQVLKKYAVFSGRARRKEYWMFALFNIIFLYAAIIIDMAAGTTYYDLPYGVVYSLYTLAILIPGFAVTVRRLHDVGKSGWMILIALIPIIGGIWLFVLMVTDSEPGKNDYGENPKDGQEDDVIADQKTGDTIILVVVIWLLFWSLFATKLSKIVNIQPVLEYLYIHGIVPFIFSLIPVALAFAVVNKKIRLWIFILSAIYLLSRLFDLVSRF